MKCKDAPSRIVEQGQTINFRVALRFGRFTMQGKVTEVFPNGNFEIEDKHNGLTLIDKKTIIGTISFLCS